MATLSLSCLALPSKLRNLSLTGPSSYSSSNQSSTFKSLGFLTNLSHNYLFSNGNLSIRTIERPSQHLSVVSEAAPTRKANSAAKRARQVEKRCIYNKSCKSKIKTRMKKNH